MKKLIIIGAGGNSKVILDSVHARRQQLNEELEIVGFLDDDVTKKWVKQYPVLGGVSKIETYSLYPEVAFIDGIGSNSVRKLLYDTYIDVKWYTLIHPSAIIGSGVTIGAGTVIMPGVIINTDTQIGKKSLINTGAIIEHDNVIGNFTHIASGTATAGAVEIGELTMLGTGTKVIQGISIGRNTMVGAGAVVVSHIPSNCTAVGVPARIVKSNNS